MRLGLVVVLVVAAAGLLLALLWLARASPRSAEARPNARPADGALAREAELPVPETLGDAPAANADSAPASESHRAKPQTSRTGSEVSVAPIRGRLVVAESGVPIEGTFSVRLRTVDLLRSEDLRTNVDGSFRGSTLFPRSVVLALVKEESGRELVDQEALFEPSSEEEWLVRVPESHWPTFARGQVLDRRGNAIEGAKVSLVPLAVGLPPGELLVEGDGSFHLEPLRAGPYRLFVQGRFARATPVDLELRSGANELGLLVLDEPEPAGDLVLRIAAESGVAPTARFELRAEVGGRTEHFDTSLGGRDASGTRWLTVPDLPAGRYTLAVHALDGLVYEPASLAFSPPAELEIRATGTPQPGTLFRARDARTGEPLLGFSVFGRRERTWLLVSAYRNVTVAGHAGRNERADQVRLRPGFESWVVSAPGYRAAFGAFAGAPATIVVDLEPGWSELYQFEDAGGDSFALLGFERFLVPPVLPGVEVHADGQLVGESDSEGFYALSGEREPDSIAFQKPGWLLVNEYRLGILRTVVLVQTQ